MTEHDPTENHGEDADGELELEPVDPEILAHQRRQAARQVRQAEDGAETNEDDHEAAVFDPIDLGELKNFRFSVKHLLIGTALLSVVMTLNQLTDPCAAASITLVAALAAAWWIVIRGERQQAGQTQSRHLKTNDGDAAQQPVQGKPTYAVSRPKSVEIPIETRFPQPAFNFSFSLQEMLGAFTAAAIAMGLVRGMGGPDRAAILLGGIALLGLVLHAVGFDPPRIIILGWWLLLVLYLVVGIWAAFGSDQAAAQRPAADYQVVRSGSPSMRVSATYCESTQECAWASSTSTGITLSPSSV